MEELKMKFIEEGSEMVSKKVGGNHYGYIYLPKAWIGSKVAIIRKFPEPKEKVVQKPTKMFKAFKSYSTERLKKDGYRVSDEPITAFGKRISNILVGEKKNRSVIVSFFFDKMLEAKDINSKLSSASNVLYIVLTSRAKISTKASRKVKRLANVVLWRYQHA
jgi:hypothetical protein